MERKIAQVIVANDAEIEELAALKRILEQAGLIVKSKGRELLILVKE